MEIMAQRRQGVVLGREIAPDFGDGLMDQAAG